MNLPTVSRRARNISLPLGSSERDLEPDALTFRVEDLSTGVLRAVLEHGPTTCGKRLAWKGFALDRYETAGLRLNQVRSIDHVVLLQVQGVSHQTWSYEGSVKQFNIEPGQVSLIPAGLVFTCDVRPGGEFIAVSITKAFFWGASIAAGVDEPRLPLRPMHGVEGPLVRELVTALARVTFDGMDEERDYGECLAYRLAVHLAVKHDRRWAFAPGNLERRQEGLHPDQLAAVLAHLDAHFAAVVRLKDLAEMAGMSRFHFVRQFKRSVGLAPHQYLTRLRIEEARRQLSLPRADVTEVARAVGFCNANHLARHFRAAYGITPSRFLRLCPREHAGMLPHVEPVGSESTMAVEPVPALARACQISHSLR